MRSGTTDTDVGKRERLLYAKSLARSVVNKQAQKGRIDVVREVEVLEALQRPRSKGREQEERVLEVDANDEAETSLWCGDEEVDSEKQTGVSVEDISDEEEDEEPVIDAKNRRRLPQTRRVVSDSEDDESEDRTALPAQHISQPAFRIPEHNLSEAPLPRDLPQTLASLRSPHKKGHSTISNWAHGVIDLTSSPEVPASFVLPPPSHARSSSFAASSRPTSSASNGALAILTYSPTPTKHRSPCKAPPISRPSTPPLPPASPTKLVSPSKKRLPIPKATELDGRPSLDAFWNPEAVNDWNDHHSPVKPLVSPKKQKWRKDIVKMMEGIALEDSSDEGYESPTTSHKKKQIRSPAKKIIDVEAASSVKELRAQRKAFAERKHAMAEAFLTELDDTICSGRIAALSSHTGGIKLIWSKTLKTTAGRANWRREQIRIRTGPSPTETRTEIRHHCSIELAEKVIDDEERLYNVLAHEFCHLTTFMISEVRNNPHGAEFKAWGRKATTAFAHKGVEVTTKHSYQIEYKYIWECVTCGYEFKRHSKSIDPVRHSCGKCKGKLAQTKPTPRGAGVDKDGKREKSEYQVFVKENFTRVKMELADRGQSVQMGKVMEAVARAYRDGKAKKDDGVLETALQGLKI